MATAMMAKGEKMNCDNCLRQGMCSYEAEYKAIDDETARKITEEADKACAKCKELNCWECEYVHWRHKRREGVV